MHRLVFVSSHRSLCTRRAIHSYTRSSLRSPLQRRLAGVTAAATLTFGVYLAWPGPSRHAPTSTSLPLAFSHFTPATIESSEDAGPSTKLITLIVPPKLLPSANDHLGPIHSIYVKDDDIQVERPYTPLFGIESSGRIRLWVKRYEYGEVGRWLHGKKPGDVIEIRGPAPTWDFRKEVEEGRWDDIIMISGGTGITPFFQFIHSYFKENSPSPDASPIHLTLLHTSPTPAHLPPPLIISHLQSLASSFSSFSFKLFVDQLDNVHQSLSIEKPPIVGRRISREDINEVLVKRGIIEPPSPVPSSWWPLWPLSKKTSDIQIYGSNPESTRRVLFLVCGPEPMVDAIAGPRGQNLSSGPVRGILGDMGFTSTHVRKF